ncbi:MAG: hypothetical protein L0Y71_05325 [Gemmataceae bacterium]|nr:hypothetical protein [Gemmataceae bacterium]
MSEDFGEQTQARASWTKLFTAFRIALDLKKLLLAAGGLVATAIGWWFFAWVAYSIASMPQWEQYSAAENKQEAWQTFKYDRGRWNLLHEMAGDKVTKVAEADVAGSLEEFLLLEDLRTETKTLDQLKADAAAGNAAAGKALATYQNHLAKPKIKPFGRLRSSPWSEDRGPNQYLMAEGFLRQDPAPWAQRGFFPWLLEVQLPVLLEPLRKFLSPIGYFFNSDAGGFRNRAYLIAVILWTLAVWGFFGGAICRIAAVQIAKNEKIALREAVGFAKEKFVNLFTAPLFPLIFLGILTVFLIIFGLLEGFLPWFGDIFLAGLLWPVVIAFGLIMAVVVVGLIGWPLMNPTIAAEGSDNFDALSRSYSYVYQAFWHYLGYWGVALAYGAALVFFIGFMGSLVVYMGKWGFSQAPGLQSSDPARDRDPAYLFIHAPESFGWRDLLIRDHPHVEKKTVVNARGELVQTYEFKEEYLAALSVPNKIGAVLVGVWVGLFFLLVVGFAYSFFWTASTLIYFLMRQHVDDTEFEEVYFEEPDLEPPPSMPPAATAAAKPNTVSLNVVEGNTAVAAGLPPAAPVSPIAEIPRPPVESPPPPAAEPASTEPASPPTPPATP